MFRYQDTKKVSQPGELQRKIITEVRRVTYLNDNPNPKVTEPVITEGYEPVKELVVSSQFVNVVKTVGQKTVDNRKQKDIK